jgi:hypothetical protein
MKLNQVVFMKRVLALDQFFKQYSQEHRTEIEAEAAESQKTAVKPKLQWTNQLWPGYKMSPGEVNRSEQKFSQKFVLLDAQKIKIDLRKMELDKTNATHRIDISIDEWALHYSTYKVEIVSSLLTTAGQELTKSKESYIRPLWNTQSYIGSWPFCVVKRVVNPKTQVEEFYWAGSEKREQRYIRVGETYFSQLRHEIYFRGLRIPAFHSRYGGEVTFRGETNVATRYIEDYLDELFTLEQLITLNKMLKEIQITNLGQKRGLAEAGMTFSQLYTAYVAAGKETERLKKQIEKVREILPPPESFR